jgi:hypothetical protein
MLSLKGLSADAYVLSGQISVSLKPHIHKGMNGANDKSHGYSVFKPVSVAE